MEKGILHHIALRRLYIRELLEVIQQTLQLYWNKKRMVGTLLVLFYLPADLVLRWLDTSILGAGVFYGWNVLDKDSAMFALRLFFYLPIQVPLLVLAWLEWEELSPTIQDVVGQFRNQAAALYGKSLMVGCIAFVLLEACKLPYVSGAFVGGSSYLLGGTVLSILLALSFLCVTVFILVSTLFLPYFSATDGYGLTESLQVSFYTIKIRCRWVYLTLLLIMTSMIENGLANTIQHVSDSLQLPLFILLFVVKLLLQPISCFFLTYYFLNWTQTKKGASLHISSSHTKKSLEEAYASIMEMD